MIGLTRRLHHLYAVLCLKCVAQCIAHNRVFVSSFSENQIFSRYSISTNLGVKQYSKTAFCLTRDPSPAVSRRDLPSRKGVPSCGQPDPESRGFRNHQIPVVSVQL